MRLTLRTLLAYRDGVLSPADHADLHRRIQQSTDAGNLLRRIQELTSSSEILSPKLESTGLAGANVIAEYLDDVLTSTRIAELERLFLEYNEHLCELAHCHRMLAEAMHTQVEVPDQLYRKSVELIQPAKRSEIKSQLLTQSRKLSKQVIVAEAVEANSAGPNSPQPTPVISSNVVPVQEGHGALRSTTTVSSSRSNQQAGLNLEGASLTNEVPEYLLGARKRRWQIPAAILALTALLFLLVMQSVGSLDDLQALMFAGGADNGSAEGSGATSPIANGNGQAKEKEPSQPTKQIPESPSPNPSETKQNQPTPADSKSIDSQAPSQADVQQPGKAGDSETASESAAAPAPSSPPTTPAKEVAEADVAKPDASKPDASKPDASKPDASKPDIPVPTPEPAAGWIWKPADAIESQSVVLLGTGDSVSPIDAVAQPIVNGKIVCPPVSRATFTIGELSWQAVGPSAIDVEVKDAKVTIKTSLCRALVSATAPDQVFSLITPAGNFEVQLLDKSAWLGIEVNYRAVAKGSIVESNAYAPVLVIVVATEGATTRPDLLRVASLADQQVVKIDSTGRGIAIVKDGQMESFALQSPPIWYRKRSVRPIDQLGMADFQTALAAGVGPLNERLRSLATDPRPEVAALAIQTSALLGDWQPWASALLTSDRMRSHWNHSIDLAKQLLAANPTAINPLKAELQTNFGADSDKILSLLVGLPQADQTIDSLTGLTKGLDANAMLPIRVLTAYELKRLTGEDFSYQPHAPLRASLQQWRSRLAGNKIQFLPVNDPIVERYPR